MAIVAKIIADSISPQNIRLTTFQLRYPKFLHGEFMTHRVFSRNASSSRAIPVERMIQDVLDDPVIPMYWGKNQPGMSAAIEVADIWMCRAIWLDARDAVIAKVRSLLKHNLHKQIANRLLEPWLHINVVATATQYSNFFALRDHSAAQPEIQELAVKMKKALAESVPQFLKPGEWHLPYVLPFDRKVASYLVKDEEQWILRKISVARCASVSYKTVDGMDMTFDRAVELHDKLVAQVPLHASPCEHQATPDELIDGEWAQPDCHGNLTGYCQYRKMLPGECQ